MLNGQLGDKGWATWDNPPSGKTEMGALVDL
jgi:hypothetical protein